MARKELYDPDTFPLKAQGFAREGLNDEEIAEKLGIGKTVYYEYQKKYPEFANAIKEGKAPVDREVENALLKRAQGYDYTEKKVLVSVNEKGEQKPARIETITKHVPPDVGAIAFWLKNRMPDKWRDRQDLSHTFPQELPFDVKIERRKRTEPQ